MSSLSLREKLFAASTLAGLMAVVAVAQGLAQQEATPPISRAAGLGSTAVAPSSSQFRAVFPVPSPRIRRIHLFPTASATNRPIASPI